MKFCISVLSFLNHDHMRRCIASVLKHSSHYQLILTANGNPEVAKYFKEVAAKNSNIQVVVNQTNEGFIAPNLHALTLSNSTYTVLLNDDVEVSENWLDLLAAPFATDPKCALTGPHGGCTGLRQDFVGTMNGRFEYLEGSCLMGRTDLLKKHGLFDPELKFAYGEDSDLSLRMRQAGYNLHQVAIKLKHVGGATSSKVPEVRQHFQANHDYLRQKWSHYMRVRRFDYPILIKREGALGDVLLTTPIIRALKQRNPAAKIWVETMCPEVLYGNPHVERIAQNITFTMDTQVINLNGSYEMKPNSNYVRSYAESAGLKSSEYDLKTEMHLATGDMGWAMEKFNEGGYVVFHTGPTSWKCRNWPNSKWAEVINAFWPQMRCVVIGSEVTVGLEKCKITDLRGRTTIGQMAAVISRAKMLVGLDSLGIHIAQAFGVPVVGLFGLTLPQYVFTEGSPHFAVCSDPEHPASGLRHKIAGKTFVDHPQNPMDTIEVEAVKTVIEEALCAKA
jgi:ADP-heptose:LPS heptosyltransferase/GT2 family glycosyltransferase